MIYSKPAQIKTYYLICLFIGIIWVHFTPESISKYGILFFSISTFPIFGFNHVISFLPFKKLLKELDEKTFNSHSVMNEKFGTTKTSNLILFSDQERLDNINNKDFQKIYKVTKTSFVFTVISFFTIIALAFSQILVKWF